MPSQLEAHFTVCNVLRRYGDDCWSFAEEVDECTVQLLVTAAKIQPGPSLAITDHHTSSTDLACCVTKPLLLERLSKPIAVISVASVAGDAGEYASSCFSSSQGVQNTVPPYASVFFVLLNKRYSRQ